MVNKEQIDQWLRDGTITQEQANKMLADSLEYRKEKSSNKLIVAVSTIGSILLGIGAILFIASNWAVIPNIMKILILVGSTFGAYYAGYLFKYQKQNLPKVGASLIFLGALLFGATIFLIAQIYNINANSHVLILIWLIGVLPLVYAFESSPIAGLSALLFFIWIGLFVFQGLDFYRAKEDFFKLPVLYLVAGVLLFGVGTLHYLSEKLESVARVYRLAGIKIAMSSLFFLTFRSFSGFYEHTYFPSRSLETSPQFTVGFVLFSVLAILFVINGLFFNPSKSSTNTLENLLALGLTIVALVFFFFPATTNIYVVLFNLILVGVVFMLLFVGYQREDMQIVNIGMSWFSALIFVRYFDFFWDILPRSLFFMVGGLILVLGGIALEKKRRQLKTKFSAAPLITQ
jgi:uncharacterized membrane protein